MAEIKELHTRLITRNDTHDNWVKNDPVLMPGEIAISISEKLADGSYSMPRFKVGISDGTVEGFPAVKWSEIEYCLDTAELIERINNIQPTAENTVFNSDMTVTYNFGKYKPDSTGSITVPTSGKTVYEALLDAFAEAKEPTVDYPSVSISVSGGSGEVGTTFTRPTATLKIDDVGSYTYGSKDGSDNKYGAADTGVHFAIGDVTLKRGDSNTISNDQPMGKGGTLQLQANSGETTYGDTAINYTFTATASYTASDRVPVDNLGTKKPNLQISDGSATVTSRTATFSGYRKAFWGYKLAADALTAPEALTSAQVRELQKSGKTSEIPSGTGKHYTVPAGTKQVFFVLPKGTKSALSIANKSALGAPVACTKVAGGGTNDARTGIWVEGANSYAAIAYDMWYVNLGTSTGFSGDAELELTWTN